LKYLLLNFSKITIFIIFLSLILSSMTCIANEGVDFTGSWKTAWGPVTIIQTKIIAKGKYTGQFNGQINGTVEGNRFRFKWSQTNGEWGRGYFDISPDGKSFKGRWGGYNSDSNGGVWNGKKL